MASASISTQGSCLLGALAIEHPHSQLERHLHLQVTIYPLLHVGRVREQLAIASAS